MTSRTVLVVAGGPIRAAGIPVGPHDAVIAADSGLGAVLVAGLVPTVVVGDLDSVDPGDLARAEGLGATIERHPAAKDQTDLELALELATARRPDRIVVVADLGGRADHALAAMLLLASPTLASAAQIEAHVGDSWMAVLHGPGRIDLSGRPGDLVSLLPAHGAAEGVRTGGLRYPLCAERLAPGSTRGVSNVLDGASAWVTIETGTLLVVRPGAESTREP